METFDEDSSGTINIEEFSKWQNSRLPQSVGIPSAIKKSVESGDRSHGEETGEDTSGDDAESVPCQAEVTGIPTRPVCSASVDAIRSFR